MAYSCDELKKLIEDRRKFFELRNKLMSSYSDFLDYVKVVDKDGYLEYFKDYINNLVVEVAEDN